MAVDFEICKRSKKLKKPSRDLHAAPLLSTLYSQFNRRIIKRLRNIVDDNSPINFFESRQYTSNTKLYHVSSHLYSIDSTDFSLYTNHTDPHQYMSM